MTVIGYTMMWEQAGAKELVRGVQLAEAVGFEFAVISNHYFPWVDAMGHSPYAWSVLGAAPQVTSRIELMTCVTCPTKRYHPAVAAQKAATVGVLSDGRFILGLGAEENLNEHVTGSGWPPVSDIMSFPGGRQRPFRDRRSRHPAAPATTRRSRLRHFPEEARRRDQDRLGALSLTAPIRH
jgi:hypothetical protein